MLLALIAIVPLLLDRVRDIEIDRGDAIALANRQALGLARQAMTAHNEVIQVTRAFLQVVTSARSTFPTSDSSCSEFLTKSAGRLPWLTALSVVNLQGKVVCSSLADAIGLDVSEREFFIRAVDSADFVLSDYFIGSLTKAPIVAVTLAQQGANGGAASVAVATIDLSWFTRIARTFELHQGAVMMMIDSKGTLLARYPDPGNWVGMQFADHPLTAELLSAAQGTTTATSYDGIQRITGFAQVPGTQVRVAVGFNEDEVLAHVNHAMWIAIAEMGIVAALVLLGIWFGGERLLMRPVRALSATAARIGRDSRLKSRATDLPWATEFVPLAAALDDMAGQLLAREQDLRDTNMQLRELAQLDALTGLSNRRTFNGRLADEWSEALRHHRSLAVLMIDVDFFKPFNDHYGHLQGDNCLRKVAAALKSNVRGPAPGRKPDCVARYGGEEFAVLLPGAEIEAAIEVGERLRDSVENLLIAHVGASRGFVTISVGAASLDPILGIDPDSLTQAADTALYEAKQRGRNAVVASPPVRLSQAS